MTTAPCTWWNWPAAARAAGVAALLLAASAGPGRAQPAPVPRPRIQRLYNTANPAQDSVFALDTYLTLEVANLGPSLRAEEARLRLGGAAPAAARAQARRLVLYLNDAPLIGMPPESLYALPPAAGGDTLSKVIFHLLRRPSTHAYWNVVYRSPWEFAHPAKVGLGYDERVLTDLYPTAGAPRRFQLVHPVALGVALALVLALAGAIVQLARKSWLLRTTPTGPVPAGQAPPFSLAKSQLALWTFLVLGAYVLIYCVTGATTAVTVTTLELLGISAGTAGLGGLLGQPAAGGAGPPRASRGWWLDVLSDEQGVSLHRLQQLGFTLLLGYLFVRTVYKTVALPDWNENEILLLGLSSATYLGLKSQENKPAADPPAPPARRLPPAGAVSTTAPAVPPAAAPAASPAVNADWLRAKDYAGPAVPAQAPASN